jgi:accessory gene regulator protein AgrB
MGGDYMSIEKFCDHLAKHIVTNRYNNQEDIEVISYGICALLTSLLNVGLAIIISYIIHIPYYLITFVIFFIPIRVTHAGYHCKTFLHCLITTNTSFLTCAMICYYLSNIYIYPIIVFLLIVLHYLISKERRIILTIFITLFYILNIVQNWHLDIYFVTSLAFNILLMMGGKWHECKNKNDVM